MSIKFIEGSFFQFNVGDLGEFRFLFSENKDIRKGTDKYFVECFWNPPNYGLVNFIVGYYCADIDNEIERILNNSDYFIDGARVACECRIENDHDDEGVYQEILDMWFSEDDNMSENEDEEKYPDIEQYLNNFDKDDLIELANKLDIKIGNLEDFLDEDDLIDDLIEKILESESDDVVVETCEELFGYSYIDFIIDNVWRHSDYESKDIGDWDVDDHLAAWFDHMMEK